MNAARLKEVERGITRYYDKGSIPEKTGLDITLDLIASLREAVDLLNRMAREINYSDGSGPRCTFCGMAQSDTTHDCDLHHFLSHWQERAP